MIYEGYYDINDILLSDKGERYVIWKITYEDVDDLEDIETTTCCFCCKVNKRAIKELHMVDSVIKNRYDKNKHMSVHIFTRNNRDTFIYSTSYKRVKKYGGDIPINKNFQPLSAHIGDFIRGKAIDLDNPRVPLYNESVSHKIVSAPPSY